LYLAIAKKFVFIYGKATRINSATN